MKTRCIFICNSAYPLGEVDLVNVPLPGDRVSFGEIPESVANYYVISRQWGPVWPDRPGSESVTITVIRRGAS